MSRGSRPAAIRPFDYVILLIATAAVVLVSVYAFGGTEEPTEVSVQSDEGEFLYPLDEYRLVDVEGPVGHTHVEIEDGRARVLESPCRDQICVAAGWLEHTGDWAACLPNRVFVRIEGGERSDAIDGQTY